MTKLNESNNRRKCYEIEKEAEEEEEAVAEAEKEAAEEEGKEMR